MGFGETGDKADLGDLGDFCPTPYTLNRSPTPYTLHPTPHTLFPTLYANESRRQGRR
ncbi:MAG: hypothetical protein F6J93_22735 [Oscillatoria sp. SIO1A7]|nr:hypothetical protein [Oscillatoria sp. SIO1A7]